MGHRMITCLAALATTATVASGQNLPEIQSLEGDPVVEVLPPDAIPAIDEPKFVSAKKGNKFMQDDEAVLGVVHEGEAKAYSLWHLDRHEIVNDTLKETPVGVTW